MRKVITSMFGVLALMVSLLIVSVVTARPALAVGECNPNGVCFYDTSSDWNAMIDWDGSDTNGGACYTFPSSYQSRTSYVWNRSGHQWKVYTSTNCSTSSGPIYANTQGAMTGGWNNTIKSLKY